ncbi:hypothetical protein Lal_00021396 [Lupinus albus]|nr:hypothetical protein Lal_00021396 [Lupinus albus]
MNSQLQSLAPMYKEVLWCTPCLRWVKLNIFGGCPSLSWSCRGWERGYNLWLECESSWVVDIFNGKSQPPWKLSNFRNPCSELWSTKNLKVNHIFRESNDCLDKLAVFGVQNGADFWWDETPQFLMEEYNRNRFQLFSYRFTYV